jgi:hypothetical protein
LIIMDYSQIALSTLLAELKNTNNSDISVPLVRHMILNSIRANRQKFYHEYGELVIACDSRHYWRKDQFAYYKANRKEKRKDSSLNWDQVYAALEEVKSDLIKYFPYPVIDVHGAEADDIIGTLARWTNENEFVTDGLESGPQPVLILSGDHDFVQLQKFTHVQQYAPIQKKWVKAEGPVNHILTEHVLRGDSGDGIPNFMSDDDTFVTEKKRQKSMFEKDMVNWKTQPLSVWENTPYWENIQRNQTLIDLSNTPTDLQTRIINSYLEDRKHRNRSQLINYFMTHKMNIMMQSVGDF